MDKTFSRVLIKDEVGHLLVVRDREESWNFPGGKREENETAMECAKREVEEEVGLDVLAMHEICRSNFIFEETKWKGYFYFASEVKGVPSMNEPEKMKGMQFVQHDDAVNFPKEMKEITTALFRDEKVKSSTTIWR